MEHGGDKRLHLYDNSLEYALTTAEIFHNLIIKVSVKNENILNIKMPQQKLVWHHFGSLPD